jgi:uncharacterized protein YjbJ (UPF0337 family)
MNWDKIQGEWKEAKGKLRAKWGKLTDDDLESIAGKKDVLSQPKQRSLLSEFSL